MPDIDIDFADRTKALALFDHTVASRVEGTVVKPHNTGIYVTPIPKDVRNNLATIEYRAAEARGYFKIDFLNVNVYAGVRDESHLTTLLETEPLWDLLLQDDFSNLLFHVNGHGSILREMMPQSIAQLAAVLAMIRPAKRYLIGKDWSTVEAEVWLRPEGNEYFFKKAHAVAYAAAIVVQMNLICEGISIGYN